MPLKLNCTACGQTLSIPDALKGKEVRCPKCKATYMVTPSGSGGGSPGLPRAAPTPRTTTFDRPAAPRQVVGTATGQRRAPSRPAVGPAQTTPTQASIGAPASAPVMVNCPGCSTPMRVRPTASTSTFQCPKCSTRMQVQAPQSASAATVARSGVQDDLFSNLPPTTGMHAPATASSANWGGGNVGLPNVRSTTPTAPSRLGGAASASRGGTRKSSKSQRLLGPGLLIAIPNALALSASVVMMVILAHSELAEREQGLTFLYSLMVIAMVYHVAVTGMSVWTITGAPRWAATTTCILALMPVMFNSVFCLGVVLYPIALGGGVWGLVVMYSVGKRSGPGPVRPRVGAGGPMPQTQPATSAGRYLAAAREDLAKKGGSQQQGSSGKAMLQVLGGIGCLCFVGFLGFVVYQHFNGAQDWQLRRPGKAIGTMIFLSLTGLGLIGKGISDLSRP